MLWASNRELAVISRQLIAVGRQIIQGANPDLTLETDMLNNLGATITEHMTKVAAVMDAGINERSKR